VRHDARKHRHHSTRPRPACKALLTAALYPGSASVFDGALAQGYGSCLLPLRLHSLYSQATRFSVRPKQEVLSSFACRTHSPSPHRPCAFRSRIETFRRGRLAKRACLRAGPSSNRDQIQVTGSAVRAETTVPKQRDSNSGRFLRVDRRSPCPPSHIANGRDPVRGSR